MFPMTRLLPLLAAVLLALPAWAQTRHALVVGIDRYAHIAPLQKAVNDARGKRDDETLCGEA